MLSTRLPQPKGKVLEIIEVLIKTGSEHLSGVARPDFSEKESSRKWPAHKRTLLLTDLAMQIPKSQQEKHVTFKGNCLPHAPGCRNNMGPALFEERCQTLPG